MINPTVGGIDNVHHQVARMTDEAEEATYSELYSLYPEHFQLSTSDSMRASYCTTRSGVLPRAQPHSGSYADSMEVQ
jgi:hypothetical protein